MKKSTVLIILGAIVGLVLIVVMWATGIYNSLVSLDEGVKQSWSQVENQYQRRLDLIPNLVETVKGYAAHESSVFIQVTEARSNVGKLTVTPEILNDPRAMQKFQEAQAGLSSALSRLLAVAENYPTLKANENFMQLQQQLEGTENRIAVERKRFNEVVQEYNTRIRRFPAAMLAGMFGFTQKAYFEAEAGAEKAPGVSFK
jgi:LemA protein